MQDPHGYAWSLLCPGLRMESPWLESVCDLVQLAPALGGFALATELAGALYDRQAAAQDNHTYCKGSLCFRQSPSAPLSALVHGLCITCWDLYRVLARMPQHCALSATASYMSVGVLTEGS